MPRTRDGAVSLINPDDRAIGVSIERVPLSEMQDRPEDFEAAILDARGAHPGPMPQPAGSVTTSSARPRAQRQQPRPVESHWASCLLDCGIRQLVKHQAGSSHLDDRTTKAPTGISAGQGLFIDGGRYWV